MSLVWLPDDMATVLRIGDGYTATTIPGQRYGRMFVHESTLRRDRASTDRCWTLSHHITGRAIAVFATEAEAKSLGEELWQHYCLAFMAKTAHEVLQRLQRKDLTIVERLKGYSDAVQLRP